VSPNSDILSAVQTQGGMLPAHEFADGYRAGIDHNQSSIVKNPDL